MRTAVSSGRSPAKLPGCAASISSAEPIPTGEWTHVTVTNDGSRKAAGLKIFINGLPAETTIVCDSLTRDYPIGDQLGLRRPRPRSRPARRNDR